MEVVFSNSEEQDTYHIGGNLKFMKDYTPKEIEYNISYPSGESQGTLEGKSITIPNSGGTRLSSIDDIEEFASAITLNVRWKNNDGELLKESIQLD